MDGPMRFATKCIHAGQTPDPSTGAIATPVYQTSTYVQPSPGEFIGEYDYSRSANPTRTALEANIACPDGMPPWLESRIALALAALPGGYGWVFFPRYSRMGRTFGMPDESIGRSDWDAYRDHRRRREPYFGPDQKYGTQGSYTKTTHRSFFERQKARKAASRRSFTDKVRNRAGRAGSYRSRGGRGGK